MCWDPDGPYPERTIGKCPECNGPVDGDGDSTEECCSYSPVKCQTCGDRPCDGSC